MTATEAGVRDQRQADAQPGDPSSRLPRTSHRIEHLKGSRRAPLILLGLVCLISLGTRSLWIGHPRSLIFDENYYVNAARTILGLPVPSGAPYFAQPPGQDPNLEHPSLGKLAIAGGIRAFGDRPLGWRAPSLAFGTLAILALFFLVRSAGGSGWLGLGAASLLAADNLFLVHGRIATLDIFVLPFMAAGVALYLARHPFWGGMLIGAGACMKLAGLLGVLIVVLYEALRWAGSRDSEAGDRLKVLGRAGAFSLAALGAYLALLFALDIKLTTFPRQPLAHTRYMIEYSANAPEHPTAQQGLALAATSGPLEWLVNQRPINYEKETHRLAGGRSRTLVSFQGQMNPAIILLAIPAVAFALYRALKKGDPNASLAAAWFIGTFIPLAGIALSRRYNYIYYMLVVLPGICVAVAAMAGRPRVPLLAKASYGLLVLWGLVALYPFRIWGA